MKRIVFIIAAILTFSFSQAQLSNLQVNNLSTLGKLWGFLKYYHPGVAQGRYNWDSVLILKIQPFCDAKNPEAVNALVEKWLDDLGTVDSCRACGYNVPHEVAIGPDTSWIADFDRRISARLRVVMKNRVHERHFYYTAGISGQFKIANEKSYSSPQYKYPSWEWRLLTLFRYWNIVHYFSPYKSYTSLKWDSVLSKFIPLFYNAGNKSAYHVAVLKMVAALEDGHSALAGSLEPGDIFGAYSYVPFQCQVVDNKAVVTRIYSDSLCRQQGINLFDIIDSVDGQSVAERLKKYLPYVYGASNADGALASFCSSLLFTGNNTECAIVKWTPAGRVQQVIKRYNNTADFFGDKNRLIAKMLPGNIGYIDMEYLHHNDVDSVMNVFAGTKGIILDLRQYPSSSWSALASKLSSSQFSMCKMTYPDLSCPGRFLYFPQRFFGNENDSAYKGKVIVLVNSYSKSHAEYSAMGLQAATKTITIGSTTAGADGNFTDWIPLPGGIRTRFSGLGIYYPDGTLAQRNGVKIDIVCNPTIKGALAKTDELIDTAIRVINSSGK